MGSLENQVVIITGASSGIGLTTAIAALAQGARVLGVDVSLSPQSLRDDPNFTFYQGDLVDPSTPGKVVAAAISAYGRRIDALLNIAGVMDNNQSADSVVDNVWDRCIAVNLTAPVKLMRQVLPVMREQKSGSIVNVASKAALSGAVSGVAYTASKHGLIGVTKNVAWRFKHEGIRCNAVCPGGVSNDTGIFKDVDVSAFDKDAMAAMTPIHAAHSSDRAKGFAITPDDVAQSLLFLISPASRRISGAVVPVDNAWSTI
uniref:Putative short-chain dehydrogenase n=1 Tax=Emericella variicolor TaxID=1549217 RepID=A0A1L7NQ46_EMEVA|nr:putative short-chain dehydrogenase [Aspergillus stellatus]